MKLDIVLWDHDRNKEIVASPVSTEGMIALARWMLRVLPDDFPTGITEANLMGCFPVTVTPQEFMSHFDKNIRIVFYDKVKSQIINVADMTKNCLQ